MDDLISRSALLEKAEGGTVCWFDIKHAPAVDAVEVVRCKDCKFAQMGRNESVWCRKWDDFGMPVDFTCGEGERRADDATG